MTDTRLARLGALEARHPWRFIIAWLVVTLVAFAVAILGVGGGSLFSRLESGEPVVSSEAQTGRTMIAQHDPTGTSLIVRVDGVDLASPQVATAAKAASADLAALPRVATVADPFLVPGGPSQPAALALVGRSEPASGSFLTVVTASPGLSRADQRTQQAQVSAVADRLRAALHSSAPNATVTVGGTGPLVDEITDQIEIDLRTGEGIALPISFVVMVLVFGGFLAAGMPIIGAICSVAGALASLYAFSYAITLDASVVNVVTLLGLGLCIDYGLLTVSRFREELRIGLGISTRATKAQIAAITREQIARATARTVARAGRTVAFSALTVAIALTGLLVFDASVIRAIGAAGVSVVLIALAVALTLIPALCAVGARRLIRGRAEAAPEKGVFSRLASFVQRRPVAIVIGCLVVLAVLAAPAASTTLTSSGAGLMPVGTPQRDFFDGLAADYPATDAPAVTVLGQGDPAAVTAWANGDARALPGVTSVSTKQIAPDLVTVSLRTAGGPLGEPARTLVDTVRAHRPPFPNWVTGQAAGLIDFTSAMYHRAPIAIALVVLGTFVLLFLMTGSVVIPAKALAMNLVSLGAAVGVTVWVFQDGHLQGLLGFTSPGGIESFIPPLILAFGFGLSMDYEMFLIARIAELYNRGVDNDRAVAMGLQGSGRIITCAAALIVIVFAGFVAGKLLIIKETGLALIIAVLVDATLVRMLLVPATMTLLGRWNWWAPAPLRRLHARYALTD